MSDDNVTPIARKHTCPSCHLEVEHEARFSIEAHGEECMQPEIRMRRVEHALSLLKQEHNNTVDAFVELQGAHQALQEKVRNTDATRQGWELEELKTSLLALARHLLTPGECLQPDGGMYCGGCDLCPNCSTSGQFHGTCGINETLISLLNEEAGRKKHGTSESPDTQRSGNPYHERWIHGGRHPDNAWSSNCAECQAADQCGAHADASPAEPERSPDAGADAAREEPGRT